MTLGWRRIICFIGGCIVGGAVGILVNAILGAIGEFIGINNLVMNPKGYATEWLGGSTSVTWAGVTLGAGLGLMVAAAIRDSPGRK